MLQWKWTYAEYAFSKTKMLWSSSDANNDDDNNGNGDEHCISLAGCVAHTIKIIYASTHKPLDLRVGLGARDIRDAVCCTLCVYCTLAHRASGVRCMCISSSGVWVCGKSECCLHVCCALLAMCEWVFYVMDGYNLCIGLLCCVSSNAFLVFGFDQANRVRRSIAPGPRTKNDKDNTEKCAEYACAFALNVARQMCRLCGIEKWTFQLKQRINSHGRHRMSGGQRKCKWQNKYDEIVKMQSRA